ncbi:MAG: response regulator transcription factor [Actinomycetota bacterium]|nr:response regulator transcription factor [Actinomycetota bacterium]
MSEPTRILICDDHEIVREALRARLEKLDGVEVAGEASDGQEAIGATRKLRPDVVLIDIEMPRIDGITATSRIVELWPETRVLVFTAHDEPHVASLAAECGAAGYLVKSASPGELKDAIVAIAGGDSWFPGKPRASVKRDDELARLRMLSPRERQILDLLANGMRAEGVANEIGISPATVYTHVRNIVAKLEVDTRTQAVAIATRYGFLASGN